MSIIRCSTTTCFLDLATGTMEVVGGIKTTTDGESRTECCAGEDDISYGCFPFSSSSFNRTIQDCTWMDRNLMCKDYEMDFSMNVSN